jgi:hypothetical protein
LAKRLQVIENKERECGKERKEGTKRLQVSEYMGFATPSGSGQAPTQSHRLKIESLHPDTPGVLYR